ncbi:MAG: acyl-CoA dehydrogenase family protein, partial [Alphaproteobacteria bacterium]|nr:acyl-CoA dehydrogenase family protein [Alphaproteobacteria bacterium]
MRLTPTAEEAAFRDEVRGFLADSLPAALSHRVKHGLSVSRDDLQAWQAVLQARGWLAPNWPEEHGGTGWGVMRRHIFDLECRLANAPQTHGFNFGMLGPAIVRFGSEAQKSYYLPRILRGEDWWCQGYSEPEAGSDLASLRTRAERDGDDYLVNGGKIWTSFAEQANRIFCLVRTDPDAKPQQGISFLLIDLDSPGIEIRPLLAMNGRRLWNQVIFDDVRVPVDNRLGEENRGWTVAKRLLGDERIMVSRVSENKRLLALLQEVAAAEPCAGGLLI